MEAPLINMSVHIYHSVDAENIIFTGWPNKPQERSSEWVECLENEGRFCMSSLRLHVF
ncbi:hypothetical protein KP509_28G046100 [Ceratopteris richardii]|uniref:Uncharacterized protein n=1 Tax=Ceratopteris richardii TaxID=49495 RepID=A0A8T2RBT2_CERRI|nr:hypothetical protein KP509_28G046100 [Ceratopteris richardii]